MGVHPHQVSPPRLAESQVEGIGLETGRIGDQPHPWIPVREFADKGGRAVGAFPIEDEDFQPTPEFVGQD